QPWETCGVADVHGPGIGQKSISVGFVSALRALAHWQRPRIMHAASRPGFLEKTFTGPQSCSPQGPENMSLCSGQWRRFVVQQKISVRINTQCIRGRRISGIEKLEKR